MSMFTGLTNQISGMVAQKLGKGGAEGEAGAEGEVPAAAPAAAEENGEEVVGEEGQQQGGGGAMGLAQGLMMKAMAAKDGIKEKASTINAGQLQGMGANLMQNVTNLIPGKREEDVPTPPEPNPPSEIGGELVEGEEQVPE